MKLSASIMAHPDRAEQVEELQAWLGLQRNPDRIVPVQWDGEGKASGSADRVWRNARAAWLMHDRGADWHVLVQDDALVCRDFLAGLERALEYVPPDAVVSPYLGTARNVATRWSRVARLADDRGACWIRADRVAWGVCLVMPVHRISEMITFADRRMGVPDDMRVSAWAQKVGAEVWYPWPSLVDHRTIPSLTKHRAHDRVARKFHTGSALDIDWSGSVLTDPALLRRRPLQSRPRQARDQLRHGATRQ